ncbi:MAG: MBL fold metallo-hydrolase [Oscillospiraceae bacterium]|nr:MBL fold metallo-hydrolase [Oscillospiraceae bacterium]
MLIKTLPVGQLETNCYVVTDETSMDCAVIDPGDESNAILNYLEEHKMTCRAILITHGHWDHTGAANAIVEETGADLYIHQLDTTSDPMEARYKYLASDNTRFYDEGDEIHIGSLVFRVMFTPGHSPGGVTLVCEDAVFCGDTLFRGSCGRTDLPGGDINEELRSILRICKLPGEYDIYPGHMDSTTLERERNFNYYCRQALGM